MSDRSEDDSAPLFSRIIYLVLQAGHPVPQAGLPLLDISKSLTTPHSYLYPSYFSTSHLSLPYPLSLKKPGADRIPSGGVPLPRSARSCRACGQLAAGRCRRQALPWCAGCHRRRRARGLRLQPCRRSWSSAPPVVLACFPHAAIVFLACLLGVRHRCSARETAVGASPRGASNSTGGKRVHSAASNGERIRVAGAARPARSSAREPAVGASPRGASSSTQLRAGPPGGAAGEELRGGRATPGREVWAAAEESQWASEKPPRMDDFFSFFLIFLK
ncbi:uncharacterized protein LOC120673003 [Panicum virgatum]|uniref:uncharacterized protein LOC120673003 n=1 Tax=Panicum virgatum TaxID=38727 RepID=UPI0019D69767|nr:uncharacterized protein LOC120673003 [Panicum virgatum]